MPGLPHIDLIALVQFLGYPGLFTVIFLESGVFFGFFLPGASLLFIAGMLASFGIFSIWILIPLLFIAAVLGDSVGYWFGTYVGKAIYKRPDSRFFKQEHVKIAHDFYEKYGRVAVLLGRFVPIARTFTPILAGVGRMSYQIFLFYNVLGAVVWACGVTILGYTIGRHVPGAEHYLSIILLIIIGITSIPLVFTWWKQQKQEKRSVVDATPIDISCPRAAIFDLDNTLAFSFHPLPPETARGISQLLNKIPVAIMSGASIERMEQYVLPSLPENTNLKNLYLFPDTCARCYVWKEGSWEHVYNHTFTKEEFDSAFRAVSEGIEVTGIVKDTPQWGDRVLARDAQVTFAGVGVDAPADAKAQWDPDRAKRAKLKKYLDEKLSGFSLDIRISSRTAIDITKHGINKAMGVLWFAKELHITPPEMLFVGDDLKPGGNDAIVIPTGIKTHQTSGPTETTTYIEQLVTQCGARV